MKRNERGMFLPVLMMGVAFISGTFLLLSYVTSELIHASWAQTAADAAALAGASEGRQAANQAAEANHSAVVNYVVLGTDTLVAVRSGREIKTARARRDGPAYSLANVS